jgi:hypothetical protein
LFFHAAELQAHCESTGAGTPGSEARRSIGDIVVSTAAFQKPEGVHSPPFLSRRMRHLSVFISLLGGGEFHSSMGSRVPLPFSCSPAQSTAARDENSIVKPESALKCVGLCLTLHVPFEKQNLNIVT